MIVTVKNLSTEVRSVPTPANTAIELVPNEVAQFIWPAVDKHLFDAISVCDFDVECIRQGSDLVPTNKELNFDELKELAVEVEGLILGTTVCDDEGAHVPAKEMYCPSEARTALVTALEKALADAQAATEQDAVDTAKSDLESAKSIFESTCQNGTMESE